MPLPHHLQSLSPTDGRDMNKESTKATTSSTDVYVDHKVREPNYSNRRPINCLPQHRFPNLRRWGVAPPRDRIRARGASFAIDCCRVPSTLGNGQKTLDKAFAECYTWQTILDIHPSIKVSVAECFFFIRTLGKEFAVVFLGTRKRFKLGKK